MERQGRPHGLHPHMVDLLNEGDFEAFCRENRVPFIETHDNGMKTVHFLKDQRKLDPIQHKTGWVAGAPKTPVWIDPDCVARH